METEPCIFILPLFVTLPRKRNPDKKVMLNLNIYRNMHFQVNNQVKELFKPISIYAFRAEVIEISYTVYKTTKRKYDTMNIISIVDKFFLDWLVENNYLLDDTCLNVRYGSIEGKNDCSENNVIASIKILK